MHDRELYAQILGIAAPWRVKDVILRLQEGEVEVHLARDENSLLSCPECGKVCSGYDSRERRWRHLDTCQYQTILVAKVPRVECSEHGIKQIKVPWAEPQSRFTALFEALVIDWLQEASITGVKRGMKLTWDEVDGVMRRAVERGLARRSVTLPEDIGIDEKSFQKRHEFVTVVTDKKESHVLHVADGRGKECLDAFYHQFTPEDLEAVKSVSMDMWEPYISSTKEHVPDAEHKIAFDKFHVAKHLGDAVDKVRRQENKELQRQGDTSLVGTKYLWLMNPENSKEDTWRDFAPLRQSSLRTARAWAIKEAAMQLWSYRREWWARRAWKFWYAWAIRSGLEPVKKVARMVKNHLDGIVTAVVKGATNATAEGVNSVIQWIKYTARGYRNRERFRIAIYFHLGGLDLYPAGVKR